MAVEKKEKAKKKIGERAASIFTETVVNATDSSQIMAQIDDVHDTTAGKLMAEETPAIITAETSSNATVDANKRSQTMAQTDEIHNTKGNSPMAEKTMWNQGAKWPELMTGMLNHMPAFTSSNKAMEPFMELMKTQQQHGMNMYRAWIDQSRKIGEASRSGDVKKVWEACMESNKEFFNTCQEAMKEQATARNEFLRTVVPVLPVFPGTRS